MAQKRLLTEDLEQVPVSTERRVRIADVTRDDMVLKQTLTLSLVQAVD